MIALQNIKFGDCFKIKHGFAFKGEYFSENGDYVVATPGNFYDHGGFKSKNGKEKFYIGSIPKSFILNKLDLIVAMTEQMHGLLGSSALVPEDNKYLHNQRIGLIQDINKEKIDKHFLYYLFNTTSVREQIQATANGAKVRHTSPSRIYEVTVSIPSVATQRRIASILSAYDDLIENNTRRIAILEEMARRLYEEWFVNFRFPGHGTARFVETELGPAPEGWEPRPLTECAEITYGYPFKSKQFNEIGEGFGVIRIRDIKDDQTNTFTTETGKVQHIVTDGDIVIGMDGAFHMGKWAGGRAWLNQRVVRLRPSSPMSRYLLFLATEGPIKHLEKTIVGTTVAHLSARDLNRMEFLLPQKPLLLDVQTLLDPLFDMELRLKHKNANLRAQRDLLLPRLISGELDVSEAEDVFEEAAV